MKGRYRKRGKRRYNRRRKYAKRRYSKPQICKVRSGTICPDKLRVKLQYYEPYGYTVNGGGGALSRVDWNVYGNNVYDPYPATGGTTCLGLNKLMGLYRRYRVHASKIELSFSTNASNSVQGQWMVYCYPAVQLQNPAYLEDTIPHPFSRNNYYSVNARPTRIKNYMTTSKIVGVSPQAVANEEGYSAFVNGGPAYPWYWHFGAFPVAAETNIGSVLTLFNVKVTYYVDFYQRTDLSTFENNAPEPDEDRDTTTGFQGPAGNDWIYILGPQGV